MGTAKIFKSGNSQAVRLPKEYRFRGSEVEIFREGDHVVLRERSKGLGEALRVLSEIPEDVFERVEDTPPQEREW